MAQELNDKELKRQAIANLQASRDEIGAEMRILHRNLSPSRVVHRTMENHKGVIVGIVSVTGILGSLLVYRLVHGAKSSHLRRRDQASGKSKPGPGIMGIAARAVLPLLIKSVISPASIQAQIAKRRSPSSDSHL